MSKPGTIYRLQVENCEKTSNQYTDNNQLLFVDISDTDNQIADELEATVITLTGSETPIQFSTIDNSEDAFTVIKSTQLTLRVLTEDTIDLSTFAGGSAQRWLVEAYRDDPLTIFKGFLVVADMSEEFMPHPHELELVANDGLGLLKEIPLTDDNGDNPTGYNRIAEYLTWALSKTGLSLEMKVVFNIVLEADDTNHFFTACFLDAKTFEDEVGTSINCYDVIQRILGEEACLFQRNGYWWVVRIDELETGDIYISDYNTSGQLGTHFQPYSFNKEIGKDNYVIFFSDEATRVQIDMSHRKVELTYNYNTPREVPCNVDFDRGDLTDTISATEKHYDIECWTLQKGSPLSPAAADISAYIKRIFNADTEYEQERYIVLTDAATNAGSDANMQYIISEFIPIHELDKFTASIDWRVDGSIGTDGGINILFRFLLHGDDDSWWILGNSSIFPGEYNESGYKWWDTTGWTVNTGAGATYIDGNFLTATDWNTLNWEAPPAPVDGKLYVYLSQFNQEVSGWDNKDIHYTGLNFEYVPFINGSYRKYTGQSHKVTQDIENKITREKEVYISDSPKKLFKGALFVFDDPDYVLAGLFYNRAVYPLNDPGAAYHNQYGEIQAFDVWNQFRLEMRIFQAQCQGLDSGSLDALSEVGMISLLHKLVLQDTNTHTTNKRFKLLTYDINWHLCDWRGVLREVYDTIEGKDYTGHEFKYLT